jgi:hypothetical protein
VYCYVKQFMAKPFLPSVPSCHPSNIQHPTNRPTQLFTLIQCDYHAFVVDNGVNSYMVGNSGISPRQLFTMVVCRTYGPLCAI